MLWLDDSCFLLQITLTRMFCLVLVVSNTFCFHPYLSITCSILTCFFPAAHWWLLIFLGKFMANFGNLKTNIAPEHRPSQKEIDLPMSSNHRFFEWLFRVGNLLLTCFLPQKKVVWNGQKLDGVSTSRNKKRCEGSIPWDPVYTVYLPTCGWFFMVN